MSGNNTWVRCVLLVLVVGVTGCALAWAVDGQEPDKQKAPAEETPLYGAVIRANSDAAEDDAEEAPAAEETKTADDADPVVTEILQIRRRLGDDPFRGTIFEGAPPAPDGETGDSATDPDSDFNQAFSEALKAVAAGQPAARTIIEPEPARHVASPHTAPDAELVWALRQAARALDNKAADLEPSRQYDQADQLRRLANKLRRQAREYDGRQ